MSYLEEYAESELRRAGIFDENSDYNRTLGRAVMSLIRAHSAEGHSSLSHEAVLTVFNRLVHFKPLTAITSDPAEWTEVHDSVWQSRRQPSLFPKDGGKSWYDIDDPAFLADPRPVKD